MDFCIKANVKQLFLFHHAPEDTDHHVVNKVNSLSKKETKHNISVLAAKEGETWDLS